jgi:hypothetical protein
MQSERGRRIFWEKTIRNLNLARGRRAKRYSQSRRELGYQFRDKVLYRHHVLSSKVKGVSQKMELRLSRPVVIVRFLKPNVVELAWPETGIVVKKAHVSQIKKYYGQ